MEWLNIIEDKIKLQIKINSIIITEVKNSETQKEDKEYEDLGADFYNKFNKEKKAYIKCQ